MRADRPMGALSLPPAAPDLPAAARTRRPLACREHYPQESRQHYRRAPARAAVRAASLQGTVLHTKGSSALFSSLTPKSPFARRGSCQERVMGRARREEDEDGERLTARHAARSPAIFVLPYARLVAGPQPVVEAVQSCTLTPFCCSSVGVPALASPAWAPGSHCLISHNPGSLRDQSPSRKRVLHVLLHAKHPLRCLTASPEPPHWVSTQDHPFHTPTGGKTQKQDQGEVLLEDFMLRLMQSILHFNPDGPGWRPSSAAYSAACDPTSSMFPATT